MECKLSRFTIKVEALDIYKLWKRLLFHANTKSQVTKLVYIKENNIRSQVTKLV